MTQPKKDRTSKEAGTEACVPDVLSLLAVLLRAAAWCDRPVFSGAVSRRPGASVRRAGGSHQACVCEHWWLPACLLGALAVLHETQHETTLIGVVITNCVLKQRCWN